MTKRRPHQQHHDSLHEVYNKMHKNNLREIAINITSGDNITTKEAIGRETPTSLKDSVSSLTSKMFRIITKGKNEVSVEELTKFIMEDVELWDEFSEEIFQSKLITNKSVNEILHRFIRGRREILQCRYHNAEKWRKERNASKKEPARNATTTNFDIVSAAFQRMSSVSTRASSQRPFHYGVSSQRTTQTMPTVSSSSRHKNLLFSEPVAPVQHTGIPVAIHDMLHSDKSHNPTFAEPHVRRQTSLKRIMSRLSSDMNDSFKRRRYTPFEGHVVDDGFKGTKSQKKYW